MKNSKKSKRRAPKKKSRRAVIESHRARGLEVVVADYPIDASCFGGIS